MSRPPKATLNEIEWYYKHGASVKDIAERLGLTTRTIRYHLRKIEDLVNPGIENRCRKCLKTFDSPEALAGHIRHCLYKKV